MTYLLGISVFISLVAVTFYDLSLEDEYLRNTKLNEKQRAIVDALITKRAKPSSPFRTAMFKKESWNVNKRVTNWLLIYFFAFFQFLFAVIVAVIW